MLAVSLALYRRVPAIPFQAHVPDKHIIKTSLAAAAKFSIHLKQTHLFTSSIRS